jgi:soluble lytic murein transglycosylase-like protein
VPERYGAAFTRAALDTDLPVPMLVAVAQVESQMTPAARSSADARGLLQVLPSTAAALRLDVDRPAANVLAGARYLKAAARRVPLDGPRARRVERRPDGRRPCRRRADAGDAGVRR